MPPTYGFIVPVALEGPSQLEWCLGNLRRAYPDAPARVISDGVDDQGYNRICKRFKVDYVAGRYLKRIECGGEWWRRTLTEGLKMDSEWVVKLDPDTQVHRPFKTPPPDGAAVAGTVDHKGTVDENVLGGCQAISRKAAEKILASGLLDAPELKDHRTYSPDEPTLRHWKARAFMGTDMSLAWLVRNLGLTVADWPDVGINWREPPPEGDFAATHPHKLRTRPLFTDVPLRVITTCKGRLEHLKQTLPRWLAEPNVFVTVVDYDCPDGTAAWVRDNFPEVEVVHVKNRPKFNLSGARNIGAQYASGGWWCFWDADLLAAPGWSDKIRQSLKHKHYLLADPIQWNQFGSVVVHSWDFKAAGGYDNFITGWGAEDGDFYSRLRQIGTRPGSFPGDFTASIPHSDDERTAHYEEPNKQKSQALFEKYHSAKIAFMLANNRLPTEAERKELLVQAYKASGTPLPGWYTDGQDNPEPPADVEVTRGKPKPVLPPAEKPVAPSPDPADFTPQEHVVSLTLRLQDDLMKIVTGTLKPAAPVPDDQSPVPPETRATRLGWRTWFLAFTRLSKAAVCEASKGLGLIDYHSYPDSTVGQPWHFYVHTCKRCGKRFGI